MSKGASLKKLRERVGENQIEFAKRFGVYQQTLSKWETGKTPMPGPAKKLFERLVEELVSTDA